MKNNYSYMAFRALGFNMMDSESLCYGWNVDVNYFSSNASWYY